METKTRYGIETIERSFKEHLLDFCNSLWNFIPNQWEESKTKIVYKEFNPVDEGYSDAPFQKAWCSSTVDATFKIKQHENSL